MIRRWLCLVVALACTPILFAGCGGGGASLTPRPSTTADHTGPGTVSFKVVVPPKPGKRHASGLRKPRYVSPGTASVSIAIISQGGTKFPTIQATKQNCAPSGGTCTFVASACSRVIFLNDGHVVADGSPAALLASVGDARRVEMTIAGETRAELGALRAIAGVGNVASTAGAVTLDLVDDAALAAIVRVVDGWPGGLRALRIEHPDLSDVFRQLTGVALDNVDGPR